MHATSTTGENVSTTDDAQKARDATWRFSTVSPGTPARQTFCKLTQLDWISPEFCEGLVLSIAERAAAYDSFLRIDMEGSAYSSAPWTW